MAKPPGARKSKTQTPPSADSRPSGPAGFGEDATAFVGTLLDPAGVLEADRVAEAFKLTKFQLAGGNADRVREMTARLAQILGDDLLFAHENPGE